jgi:hypothetical protein
MFFHRVTHSGRPVLNVDSQSSCDWCQYMAAGHVITTFSTCMNSIDGWSIQVCYCLPPLFLSNASDGIMPFKHMSGSPTVIFERQLVHLGSRVLKQSDIKALRAARVRQDIRCVRTSDDDCATHNSWWLDR